MMAVVAAFARWLMNSEKTMTTMMMMIIMTTMM